MSNSRIQNLTTINNDENEAVNFYIFNNQKITNTNKITLATLN